MKRLRNSSTFDDVSPSMADVVGLRVRGSFDMIKIHVCSEWSGICLMPTWELCSYMASVMQGLCSDVEEDPCDIMEGESSGGAR